MNIKKIMGSLFILSALCACGKKTENTFNIQNNLNELTTVDSSTEATETTETTTAEKTTETTTEATTQTTETTETTTAETTTEKASEVTTIKQSQPVQRSAAAENAISKPDIVYCGVNISLGSNADDIASKLEPICGSSGISKAGDGKIYTYDGIQLHCHSSNGINYTVDNIEVVTSDVTTPNGMGVGSSEEALNNAYGEPTSVDGNVKRYSIAADRYMYFVMNGNTVKSWGIAFG
jgi:cytoskeletal protein RodZ